MGGLLVLVLMGLYIWAGYKIVRRVRPIWGKALVIIVAILIPTADAVYGRHKLKEMCAAEGGLRIYRVVEGVEGFDVLTSKPTEGWLKKGYRFVEGEELSGKRSRLSVHLDDSYLRELGIVPISEYVYESNQDFRNYTYHRYEQHIRVRATGEILSRYVGISYAGGWVERFLNGLYAARGTAGTCGKRTDITELVTKTLKPVR